MFPKRYRSKSESPDLDASSQSRTSMRKKPVVRGRKHKKFGGFDRIFDAITDPIIVFDTENKKKKINKAAKYFFNGKEI